MAEGGMGTIYRARHTHLDELRVIKTVKRDLRRGDSMMRFKREAQIAAKLRHPNIASVYDFVVDDEGRAFLIMEYIDGMNLFEYYEEGFRLSPKQLGVAADQILDALDYLHSQNFIHRDLSLDNVMLTRGPRGESVYKIIDLGLAKSLDHVDFSTQTGIALGKVSYISPEELTHGSGSDHIDHRSDLYSFGVVLYHLITGELPITGTDQASLIAGHLYRPPKSFELTDPGGKISRGLRGVLLKVLEKDPRDRWKSARELRDALAQHLEMSGAAPASEILNETTALPSRRKTEPGGTVATLRTWLDSTPRRIALVVATIGLAAALTFAAAKLRTPTDESAAVADNPTNVQKPEGPGVFFGNYHALVIGNNQYEKLRDLETAVRDAQEVELLLRQKYGFKVTLLENATRQDITDAFFELEQTLTPRDNLLVYYAGHGHLTQREQQWWQPVDAEPNDNTQWISTRHEVTGFVDHVPARHVLVVADSCYAGSDNQLPPVDEPIDVLASRKSRLLMTSGSLEPVPDSGGGGHSVFARVLLDLLRDTQKPTAATEFFATIEKELPRLAKRTGVDQTPTFSPISGTSDQGGMFFFVPQPVDDPPAISSGP